MKRSAVALALAAAVLAAVVASVLAGSVPVAAGDVWAAVAARLGLGAPPPAVADAIVWELRLPRALLAAAVGGGLAVTGVAMQALIRNPLAEPYVLGVSSGASAGASLFYLGFLPPLVSRALTLPLAAFLGALVALGAVFAAARTGPRLSTLRLLLAGVAVGALMASVTAFVTFASPEPQKLRAVLFWLLGSFSGATWGAVALPAAVSVLAGLALWAAARPLDALLTGEEAAESLGVPVEGLKRALIFGTALVTGVLVAAAGVVGFVGLVVPHAVRLVAGPAHRALVPLAWVVGAAFLVVVDLAARTLVTQQELPLGVLTALCGAPFFLALLRRSERLAR